MTAHVTGSSHAGSVWQPRLGSSFRSLPCEAKVADGFERHSQRPHPQGRALAQVNDSRAWPQPAPSALIDRYRTANRLDRPACARPPHGRAAANRPERVTPSTWLGGAKPTVVKYVDESLPRRASAPPRGPTDSAGLPWQIRITHQTASIRPGHIPRGGPAGEGASRPQVRLPEQQKVDARPRP